MEGTTTRARGFTSLGSALLAAVVSVGAAPPADPTSDYIVVLRGAPGTEAHIVSDVVGQAREKLAVRPTQIYTSALAGFAARLTSRQRSRLAGDARVSAILADEVIELADEPAASPTPTPAPPTTSPTPSPAPTARPPLPTPGPYSQIVPTGVRRIGRPSLAGAPVNGSDQRANVDIAIVDTGVSRHPDLNVVGGRDCTGSGTWKDRNGHGTHVAGSAAALDNGFGVVGVAPGARIWSVKVLGSDGIGKVSWLLCGIDWIIRRRDAADTARPLIEVANLSLRFKARTDPADDGNCGRTKIDVVHQAVCRATARGTTFVVAAGNDTRDASRYRPAAYSEVITVSALSDFDGLPGGLGLHSDSCPPDYARDRDDVLAKFSNYGMAVDIMAPGKCIWSTNRNGKYRPMSGTSMASPHVAGAAALYLAAHPGMSPTQLRDVLVRCGTDDWLVNSDRDSFHEPLLNISRFCPVTASAR